VRESPGHLQAVERAFLAGGKADHRAGCADEDRGEDEEAAEGGGHRGPSSAASRHLLPAGEGSRLPSALVLPAVEGSPSALSHREGVARRDGWRVPALPGPSARWTIAWRRC